MFNYLFFDLDGTLTDPAEGITNSFIHALKKFGLEIPTYEKLCSFIGPPLVETFKTQFGFDDVTAKLGVKYYREYFTSKGLYENKVYTNIQNVLETLKSKGKKLSVATSKPEPYAIQILEYFDLAKYFDFICGSNLDETRSKKSEVIEYALQKNQITNLSKVLMIGDRKHDIIGAKKNKLKSCGVLYGYGNKEEFELSAADFIIQNPEDLISIS